MSMGTGLSGAPTEQLKTLLAALHHGRLAYPLERTTLMVMGLNALADHAGVLMGLDERGVRSVLVAVLAERRAVADRAGGSTPS